MRWLKIEICLVPKTVTHHVICTLSTIMVAERGSKCTIFAKKLTGKTITLEEQDPREQKSGIVGQVGDRVAETDPQRNKPEVSEYFKKEEEMNGFRSVSPLERSGCSDGRGGLCRCPRSIDV